jgi:hypothetical protein
MSNHALTRAGHHAVTRCYLIILAGAAFLRGENNPDDRGSDSTEKALMIIAAVTVGGLVTAAVVALVNAKIKLFN